MKRVGLWQLAKKTLSEWKSDKALKLGASLSYYTIFSLPPLLLIVITVAGVLFGAEAARGEIVKEFQGLIGEVGAQIIETMIEKAGSQQRGGIASILSVLVLLMGATGAFTELQDSLNMIWKMKPRPDTGITYAIRVRLLSLLVVLGFGFLLLVSLVFSALLSAFGGYIDRLIAGPSLTLQVLHAANFLFSLGVNTLLIAMIYKFLPDAEIRWGDVWLGALVTALLFTIGKSLIGLYLGKSSISSAYGVAGPMALILLWVYYSSQILFLGAEFTQVYANMKGSGIVPKPYAMRIDESLGKPGGEVRAR